MNNNFAWTLTNAEGDLLAYQEKRSEEVVITDKDKAIAQCHLTIKTAMDAPELDYIAKMNAIGGVLYVYMKITGQKSQQPAEPKSRIILPGK